MYVQPKLRHILNDNGPAFIRAYRSKLSAYAVSVLIAVINCGTESSGYRSFYCPDCGHVKRISFTCKKSLCPSCSQWANRRFAIRFIQRMLPVTHRHLTFGMPSSLWELFHSSPKRQKMLKRAAYDTVCEIMKMYTGKDVKPGAMTVLHNFARSLLKNCHIHMIVTEGGMCDGEWVKFTYFPFVKRGRIQKTINEVWRDHVLDILRRTLPRTRANRKFLAAMKRKYSWGFYVYGPKECRIKSAKKAYNKAKYITRYVRHPPISDSRIVSYQNGEVKFWYERPSTGKRYYVTLPVLEFIYRVVMHLPEKGTHMVVSYGLYSPRYANRPIVQSIFSPSGNAVDPKDLSWREQMILQNGKDPLSCPYCGREMIEVCMAVKRRDKLKVLYRLFVEDLMAIDYPDEQRYIASIT